MNSPDQLPSSLAVLLAELDKQGITDHRRYKAVRNYLDFRAREKDIPLSGTFELTPLCNLDCKMCYVHLSKDALNSTELLGTQVWKSLIDQAVSSGMMYARLTGGECLTYPGFKDVYMHLRKAGIETVVLTNGILLGQEMTDFFKANPPACIQITLYGASEEAYEAVTGHRVFSKVMKNIRGLLDAGIPLNLVTTPNAYMHDGEDTVRLIHSLGLPIIINSGLMAPRPETGRKLTDFTAETYVAMQKLRHSLQGDLSDGECDAEALPDVGGKAAESARGVRCGAGRSSFSISWRGEMSPCNTFPGIAENAVQTGFAQAWKKINSQVKVYPLPIECEGCIYQKVCKHCVAEHAAGAPSGHANPAICAWVKLMTAEGLIKL